MTDDQRVERVERACMDLQGQIFVLSDMISDIRLAVYGLGAGLIGLIMVLL